MTVDLVLEALDNAVVAQNPAPGLILHTDLGSQYTSVEALKQLKKYEMVPSFSRKGCPYNNACIESFHATLKKCTERAMTASKRLASLYLSTSKTGIIANAFMVALTISLLMHTKKCAE